MAKALLGSLLLLASCSDAPNNRFQGYIEGEFVYISSALGGTLDELLVQRGDSVQADVKLFVLDHITESAGVAQATDQLQSAKFTLQDLQLGKREIELNVYRGQVQQALASVRLSEIQLARDDEQFKIGAVSQQQLDNSRSSFERDQGKLFEMRNTLLSGELPSRDDQILAQEAQVKAAEASLVQAQWKLDQKVACSPYAGFIFDTLYRVGEWVEAGHPVVSMLPPQNIKVRFFIPEKALSQVQIGDLISIVCDGCTDNIEARVNYISPQAEFTPPVIYSNETRAKLIYMIEAHPALKDATRLHPGQPVEVVIHE